MTMAAVLMLAGQQVVSQPEVLRAQAAGEGSRLQTASADRLRLPAPRRESDTSVERALAIRRSIRDFKDVPLKLPEVSQLLWAAQGITEPRRGFRTAPSAGATFPLELYLVAGNVQGVRVGVYRYRPLHHDLTRVADGDVRRPLAAAALGQRWVEQGAVVLVIAAVYERTTRRYGERGVRYVHMEVGHAAQNVYLQAAALGLGTVVVGAFTDDRVRGIIHMPPREHPLYLMPVGRP
jgi:SagB-type dehydrogenase family enzyme